MDKAMKDEVGHDKAYPVTTIRESHINNHEDGVMLDDQVRQTKDTVVRSFLFVASSVQSDYFQEYGDRERRVVDKGETFNEREHHHVHHIVQPIIHKETIEPHRIRTVIPIYQVTHEAPIVHKSQVHEPVSMDHFIQKGGHITGGLKHDQVGDAVLRNGECTREVDGEGENIVQEVTGTHITHAENGEHIGEHDHMHAHHSGADNLAHHGHTGTGLHLGMTDKKNFGTAGKPSEGIVANGYQGRPRDTYGAYGSAGPNFTNPRNSMDNGVRSNKLKHGAVGTDHYNTGFGTENTTEHEAGKRMDREEE
ncbi:hypothetical protein C0991_006783, partial [Blastosporella zonata]